MNIKIGNNLLRRCWNSVRNWRGSTSAITSLRARHSRESCQLLPVPRTWSCWSWGTTASVQLMWIIWLLSSRKPRTKLYCTFSCQVTKSRRKPLMPLKPYSGPTDSRIRSRRTNSRPLERWVGLEDYLRVASIEPRKSTRFISIRQMQLTNYRRRMWSDISRKY